MHGEVPDRIPFIARMNLWYAYHDAMGTLPEKYRGQSLWDLQRDLDIGIFGFGGWGMSFYTLGHNKVEVKKTETDQERITEYVTPHGTLRARNVLAAELKAADVVGMQVEYPFKTKSDYDALLSMLEDMVVEDNLETYARFVEEIGDDGVALPYSGYLPMHQLMIHYMGYETLYYELNDHPKEVEQARQLILEQQRQVLKLATQCAAEAIEVGGNYDEGMTPPPIFEQYFMPFYHEAADLFEAHGKILVVHGDGEMQRLLELLPQARVQVVEAITPQPMTTIDVRHVRSLWQDEVTFWGGIAGVIMTDVFSDDEFERYMDDLLSAVAPGNRFILGFGDNVPTDGRFDRIERIAEIVRESSTA